MDIDEFRKQYYLFDPSDCGRISAFVDFSNVRNWAKSFWPQENREYLKREIDIAKIAEVIDWVRSDKKFFYYGHYKNFPNLSKEHPFNVKYQQSIYRIDKARKSGFRVRTKEIKEIDNFDAEGKFLGRINKCNFDIEMTMDILTKINTYDTMFLWSGDSDFCHLLMYLRTKKKRVITICARDFASEELRDNSDKFIPADPLKDLVEYKRLK
ncbi:MAG: NYN domain-containing protein [Parcubacteria group bacterium]|nr:NYN domain-containing protein [Parcubacteria group bacterium]